MTILRRPTINFEALVLIAFLFVSMALWEARND